MNPHIINLIIDGHNKKMKDELERLDALMWQNGLYTKKAFEVVMAAFEAGLSGKQSKDTYFDKPFSQQPEVKSGGMSEEELQKQRELFVAKLMAMQSNFEINHPKKKKESEE